MFERFLHRGPEGREQEKTPEFVMSAYVLRHAESSENKMDPKRGLTEKGQKQVREAMEKIIKDLDPKRDIVRLYDSNTDRTNQQLWIEHEMLTQAGFEPYVSEPSHKLANKEAPENSGPGIAKRLAGVTGPKEGMQILRDPAYQAKFDTDNPVTAWLKDSELPAGISTPAEKIAQFQTAVDSARRIAERMREKNADKRVVVIANSHSSGLTAYAAEQLRLTPDEIGEVENAEGFRLDLSGQKDDAPRFSPFGENIERLAAETGR